ncbi:hypothetical protein C0J52_16661 [Blattella germanica]|nr:hypothetical protein C0J52_16661 [Blattella germanica]
MQLTTTLICRITYVAPSGINVPSCWKMQSSFFDLIPKLKASLRGRRFHTREDIANAVRHEISRLDNGAADGITRLPHRWQRTVDCLGDYFEGC